jgi:hypothetical protein
MIMPLGKAIAYDIFDLLTHTNVEKQSGNVFDLRFLLVASYIETLYNRTLP